ncbi:hypothetical protein BDN67DRAFT_974416 [Paxillus ammoniavirescens]|nr:hypothetical protein BDN67DRAFT_974416 [Paxillus ammoniavirescens]
MSQLTAASTPVLPVTCAVPSPLEYHITGNDFRIRVIYKALPPCTVSSFPLNTALPYILTFAARARRNPRRPDSDHVRARTRPQQPLEGVKTESIHMCYRQQPGQQQRSDGQFPPWCANLEGDHASQRPDT